mgnify:CR=1 FL=1
MLGGVVLEHAPQIGQQRQEQQVADEQADADQAQIQKVVEEFAALKGKIKEVSSVEYGTNVSPEGLDNGFTHCWIVTFKDAKEELIEAFERAYLVELIERHDQNVSKAARAAAMDRKSITRLLKKHQIKYRDV